MTASLESEYTHWGPFHSGKSQRAGLSRCERVSLVGVSLGLDWGASSTGGRSGSKGGRAETVAMGSDVEGVGGAGVGRRKPTALAELARVVSGFSTAVPYHPTPDLASADGVTSRKT